MRTDAPLASIQYAAKIIIPVMKARNFIEYVPSLEKYLVIKIITSITARLGKQAMKISAGVRKVVSVSIVVYNFTLSRLNTS